MLSGGFDPVHVGHIRMFKEAVEWGDVIIALNSDNWLRKKKKYCFMPWEERQEILLTLWPVSAVVKVIDRDSTVRATLRHYNPTYFGNGGDRGETNTPEQDVCDELGIQCLWDLGGAKARGSTPTFEQAALELYGDGIKELFG